MSRSRRLVLALAIILVGGSCATGRRSEVTFRDPNMDFGALQTVAVLPFSNLTQVSGAHERVRDAFITMLQATGALYVLPPGEVSRALTRTKLPDAASPSAEEVVALGKQIKADAVIAGVIREYGEVRSGNTSANAIAVSVKMFETETGRIVWSASSTKGGVSAGDRLFGGGGEPMNIVTERAIEDLLDKLFD